MNGTVSIIGCGFVADLYMRSLQAMDGITVASVYDKNPDRLAQFCTFWNVPSVNGGVKLGHGAAQNWATLGLRGTRVMSGGQSAALSM